ncbi:uncharacterized protein EURHEDRAFT_552331 [Aspergillus ruber CBS 135680]|uniref:Uncharacterized protein n=1 Tax=Aspergillus ruber (strain CBS 135680) TaxID=1388766 RepID=A0A017S1P2_ASPRC|nr:uncharacterized protein EURHEDRAFT_552331 [Aspergillus ruber CBS 135680]EYE90050.1 hypothetical protein EURHEDRAFT_552331 [Aspergillus ruber CBS 135680]
MVILTNVVGKRVGHISDFTIRNMIEALQTTTMPPKSHIKSKNSVEQEGRILLAISALKKKKKKTEYPMFAKQSVFIMCGALLSKTGYAERHIGTRHAQIVIK